VVKNWVVSKREMFCCGGGFVYMGEMGVFVGVERTLGLFTSPRGRHKE
jgi:hypothetical protein